MVEQVRNLNWVADFATILSGEASEKQNLAFFMGQGSLNGWKLELPEWVSENIFAKLEREREREDFE
ncbi:hypothetical protein QJS10_CPA02g00115 [Acorus calamus]|uniref:Uncharacterized protein n=1 Tax=Acorus calamus TaxID=4465 RepID=A0AAV9FE49_ACOCL|nr:hypothetical protein QJS10_CPA02g00115 [Acorus calamus]